MSALPLLAAGALGATLLLAAASPGHKVDVDEGVAALGFSEGLAPLDIKSKGDLSARGCASCHEQQASEWRGSMHARSLTDPLFLEGWSVEPRQRCIHCHAPLVEQVRELRRVIQRQGPRAEIRTTSLADDALAHEGVTCVVCHVREDEVLASTPPSRDGRPPAHATRPLDSEALCQGCHQFHFERAGDGGVELTGVLTQSTSLEWQRYRDAGGRASCVGCHMPGGDHHFRGAHDDALLRSSLSVTAHAGAEAGSLELSSRNVGHSLPTGDLYRHLRVEVAAAGSEEFREVARLGREWDVAESASGVSERRLARDTSLGPGEVRRVAVPVRGPFRWRVRYFFTLDKNIERSALPLEQLVRPLWSGEARGP